MKATLLLIAAILVQSFSPLYPENDEDDGGPEVDIGGALRYNIFVKNWEGEEATLIKMGEMNFDTWRINADARWDDLSMSAEYRFYSGYSFLKHGWIGYDFSDQTQMKLGVHQEPFGLLPYTANNWFLLLPYYIGQGDDYNTGIRVDHTWDNWDFKAAFYKNTPGHFTGDSDNSSRYSYDLVGDNQEVNQGNLRVAYNIGETEVGVSGLYGQLFNENTEEMGDQYAFAGHAESNWGPFNLKLQGLQYRYNPDQFTYEDGFVTMGAYDFPYQVAAEGRVYTAALSYTWNVDLSPLNSLTFYNDFAYFDKAEEDLKDSEMNVTGIMADMGAIYAYLDVANGRSHPWIGPVWSQALARGAEEQPDPDDPDAEWATRFNLNLGYYF